MNYIKFILIFLLSLYNCPRLNGFFMGWTGFMIWHGVFQIKSSLKRENHYMKDNKINKIARDFGRRSWNIYETRKAIDFYGFFFSFFVCGGLMWPAELSNLIEISIHSFKGGKETRQTKQIVTMCFISQLVLQKPFNCDFVVKFRDNAPKNKR